MRKVDHPLLGPHARRAEHRRGVIGRTLFVEPTAHQSAGLKTRGVVFAELDSGAGAWVLTNTRFVTLDREYAEAAHLHPVAAA